jgi:hypothetical protein
VNEESPQLWQIECYLSRADGDPISFVATCTLDAVGKITNIFSEIEPVLKFFFFLSVLKNPKNEH